MNARHFLCLCIGRVASNDPLFFVDLSPYGPESYPALVASYKALLVSAPPSGQTTWRPETLQWAFAVGGTMSADARKVAEGIRQLFEDWIKGQGTKVALVPPAYHRSGRHAIGIASARPGSDRFPSCRVTQEVRPGGVQHFSFGLRHPDSRTM